MPQNIPSSFWKNESKNYNSKGKLFYVIKQGDTLSTFAQNIKHACQLNSSISNAVDIIAKSNSISRINNDYPTKEKQKINIGVLKGYTKLYALYRDNK